MWAKHTLESSQILQTSSWYNTSCLYNILGIFCPPFVHHFGDILECWYLELRFPTVNNCKFWMHIAVEQLYRIFAFFWRRPCFMVEIFFCKIFGKKRSIYDSEEKKDMSAFSCFSNLWFFKTTSSQASELRSVYACIESLYHLKS